MEDVRSESTEVAVGAVLSPAPDQIASCPELGTEPVLEPGPKPNPYPDYARLREGSPIYRFPNAPVGSYLLTRFEDVNRLLRGGEFGREENLAGDPDEMKGGAVQKFLQRRLVALAGPFIEMAQHWMLTVNPPYHTHLRGEVSRAFLPRAIEAQRGAILRIADELIDAKLADGAMDLRGDFSYPLAIYVIGELIGVPREDHPRLKHLARNLALAIDPNLSGRSRFLALRQAALFWGVSRAVRELQTYFAELAEQRRQNPREDLLSTLVVADGDGSKLTREEIVDSCILLMVAGHITTVDLIGNGMLALLRHPEQLALLRERPELTESAVEEMLRYDSPVQLTSRTVRQPGTIAGVELKPGDAVAVLLGAANHDPAEFSDPETFDITRSPNRHVAFAAGIHFCLGAALARLEAQVAVARLLERLPNLALAQEPRWGSGTVLRGVQALPVRF
jgi:pimeloyl-[acyl-carrier protein] synthase